MSSVGATVTTPVALRRAVAPFFGNSLFVWGALIGVVLTGLAIGYWAGGALADRRPAPRLLLGVMALGALLVLAVPYADGPVLEWIVRWDPGPRLNPLVAAVILFGPASVVLAGVTPVAVRLVARSVTTVGRTAGRLFAVSTAGSIVGTFATAFFLIPAFGTDQLLAQGAAALLASVVLVALVERLRAVAAVALAGAVAAVAASASLAPDEGGRLEGVAARNWSPVYRVGRGAGEPVDFEAEGLDVVFRKESNYHRVTVADDFDPRYLRFDNSFQSGMYLQRPFATRFRYSDYFDLGLAYNPGARSVLFVGLGGGSAPKRMWRDFRGVQIDAVEIDPVVRDVAFRYFALPRSPRLRVTVEDGRRFLAASERRWDVIALDAFYSDSIPFHLTTREFLELVRSRLRPGGVVVANMIGTISGRSSRLFRSLVRTYRTGFPTVLVHPVHAGEGPGDPKNLMIVATEAAAPSEDFLVERWRRIRAQAPRAPDLTRAIRDRHDEAIPVSDVPTLTDDYAPTDALLLLPG